ncbi:uncharacterized protein EV422DRAFT_620718 [Fimicolochytrium jonesii]|uniref:uncharacterized protein n=1 Tax=Fimicolochytrium jonesii TaxID=1396493 RepID=UPI0022FEB56E|nr:uncharacterized protein EV422DRAFT_620718 [Fimicolochytrium jonesii]KAI8819858.1 hypothetical protein EV422DRAFT_620718 [Fimicolochytrium jonesii]
MDFPPTQTPGSQLQLTAANCEEYADQVANTALDIPTRLRAACDLRESIELFQDDENPEVMHKVIPKIAQVLKDEAPVFISNSPVQELRTTLLEIIQRLPPTEALKPILAHIMNALMRLLRDDNEDNGALALKILVDLHKNFKPNLDEWVQGFLETVQQMYKNMEDTLKETFEDPKPAKMAETVPLPKSTDPLVTTTDVGETPHQLRHVLHSFKVLAECPIVIALLFQLYRKVVHVNVPAFVPLVISCLSLVPSQQQKHVAEADAKEIAFVGLSPDVPDRAAMFDLLTLQVKTVSFIAYILRSFVAILKPHQQVIADGTVYLLRSFPCEVAATRKELLVATRHIWYTDFRQAFVQHVDILLNEEVLAGTGVTTRETLRPIAHSVLVDLIHHVRNNLTTAQLSKAIYMYSHNLHDSYFAPNIQTMCAKLLINLVDCVSNMTDKTEARKLLLKIMRAFGQKFTALKLAYPVILEHHQRRKAEPVKTEDGVVPMANTNGYLDLGLSQPIRTYMRGFEGTADVAKDIRFLFKNLVQGFKSVLNALRAFNGPIPPNYNAEVWATFAHNFEREDVQLFVRILKDGMICYNYWTLDYTRAEGHTATASDRQLPPYIDSIEEKEVFEGFASTFALIEPPVFQEIFASQMEFIVDQTLLNPTVLSLCQYFLASTVVSTPFAGLVVRFLVDNLDRLGNREQPYASVMLRLFKLLFMSVTLFPDKNEAVLRPQIGPLIVKAMKLSTKAKNSLNYFHLLRALFRSIGGGRFEQLYQEVLPLLHVLLEGLNSLLAASSTKFLKELFVELCLTVPVRLSVLLPFLSYLMKPLVLALEAGTELVSQGVRTLELCVDNLTKEFLDPIMSPVITELMTALSRHLRPLPYHTGHSHAVVRILGKLGGRNRRNVKQPKMEVASTMEKLVELRVYFHSGESRVISLDAVLELSGAILDERKSTPHFRRHALEFVKSCLPLLFDQEGAVEDFPERLAVHVARLSKQQAMKSAPSDDKQPSDNSSANQSEESRPFMDPPLISADRKDAYDKTLTRVITALFAASIDSELHDEAWGLVEDIVRHFAILSVVEMFEARGKPKLDTHRSPITAANMKISRVSGFIEAVIDTMASEKTERQDAARKAILLFCEVCVEILGPEPGLLEELPALHRLASRFCSSCYQQQWVRKIGGCVGISIFITDVKVGLQWMLGHQLEFVKALIYVLKDRSPDMAMGNAEEATRTLARILEVCNRVDENVPLTQERKLKFHSLISLLISELSDSSSAVRDAIQSSLQTLATILGREVTDLLGPVKHTLLQRIFAKPLRALPFAMQIGHIDAITYCLTLRPPLLLFGDELMRLISEALALADAEDQALVSKTTQTKTLNPLTNLRVVCINLLSAAMECPDFQTPRQAQIRARIVSVFFKSLYSTSSEVVETANKGLQQILRTQGKLPKDQLQSGLRPILVNLSDPKRLSVSGLEGLARLLQLLTNYFKVEIGKKLLDHLIFWGNATMLAEASGKPNGDVEEVKIMAAILEIFSLLPPTANIYMADMVKEIIQLESFLRRSATSPFRLPLIKFLNRYPTEAATLFMEKIKDTAYSELLADLLRMTEADEFRSAIEADATGLIERTIGVVGEGAEPESLRFKGVIIVHELVMAHPQWIVEHRHVLDAVCHIWRKHSDGPVKWNDSRQSPELLTELIVEIFFQFLKTDADDVDVLMDLLRVFEHDLMNDPGSVKEFVFREIISNRSTAYKCRVIKRFLEAYDEEGRSQGSKTTILRFLVNPMLRVTFERKEAEGLIDPDIITATQQKVWLPLSSESGASQAISDFLKVELLQYTCLLVQYAPDIISETRNDVIKFAWNHIKVEDVVCKQAAYVLLARFIEVYETPPKIVIQIYVALLRAHQSETPQGRILVRQALDILVPVLPKRAGAVPGTPDGQSALPLYIRWTRKIIVEDVHNFAQLVALYQIVARYPDLFYDYRLLFVRQMIKALSRLAFSSHANPESRILTIDLCDLLVNWDLPVAENKETPDRDEHRMDISEDAGLPRKRTPETELESPSKKKILLSDDAMVIDTVVESPLDVSPPASALSTSVMSVEDHELVITTLTRIACNLTEAVSRKATTHRVVNLIKKCLHSWSDVKLELASFEKAMLLEVSDLHMVQVLNSIEILAAFIEIRPIQWVLTNIAAIQRLMEKWIKADNVRVARALAPLISKIYDASDETRAEDATDTGNSFVRFIESKINSTLKEITAGASAAGSSGNASSSAQIYCLLSLMQSIPFKSEHHYLGDLMKLLSKLVKDHQEHAPTGGPVSLDSPSRLLVLLLHLLKPRVSQMGDHRKSFLQALVQLTDFSSDMELLRTILTMVRYWVLVGTESFPTAREKANLMDRLMKATERDPRLSEEYLDVVATIYSTPSFTQSELTVRLENAFLNGTKHANPAVRKKFREIFDNSIGRSVSLRINYIISVQNWDHLAAYFWPRQALDLLLGCALTDGSIFSSAPQDRPLDILKLQALEPGSDGQETAGTGEADACKSRVNGALKRHRQFLETLRSLKVSGLIEPTRNLLFWDNEFAHTMWVELFPAFWGIISSRERHDLRKSLIPLLAKDYHVKQIDTNPNVVRTLLDGINRCDPSIQPKLPPQLVRYLGKTHNAWYTTIELLQQTVVETRFAGAVAAKEDEKIRETTMDALCELFGTLSEDDYLYGIWRRRSVFAETNAGVSFESCGLWSQAQRLYETAQAKARSGVMPYLESEYRLWEEHWVLCAEKLQQWDLLTDLSKQESNSELFLECSWRLSDWNSDRDLLQSTTETLSDSNPMRKVYQAYMILLRQNERAATHSHELPAIRKEFARVCDEGIQSTIKRYFALPSQATSAHIPLLHLFQQFVELSDASAIADVLSSATAANIVDKTNEMKPSLSTWKDRLPNRWDDITLWSHFVAWRQHVFQMINKAYLPLIPHLNTQQGMGNPRDNPSSQAFKGFHETAWIINRFANVARKQQLIDVCNDSLSKIYTLPNIEIHEAFFKLREQAKSYFVNATDYATGLDVINNTNLLYFNPSQKAEFFALKGVFFAKLNLHEDAESAFSSAVQMEVNLPKAWAAYAQYHDRVFKERPEEIKYGIGAMNCYLHAAGVYQNGRARKCLARILWLFTLDDNEGRIAKTFDDYKGETPVWYWTTFIPQLLAALSSREAPQAKEILKKIAKQFPQALYFQLRTTREETLALKKSQAAESQRMRPPEQSSQIPTIPENSVPGQADGPTPTNAANPIHVPAAPRKFQAWEHVEEVNAVVKTAFPLLALSMETMLDQIMQRLKPTTDEDIYRLIVALLHDGLAMYIQQMTRDAGDQGSGLSTATELNLLRFSESMQPNHMKYKAAFEQDFIKSKPNLAQLVDRFREWRDNLEVLLDSRPKKQHLEHFSHWLVEFEYQKFEDIDVPGQYFLIRDNNKDFVRIDRFEPEVDLIRSTAACHRRFTIRGHDGTFHPFSVQHPAAKHCRREERIMQLFRILNDLLERRVETRRRNLSFHLPLIVPLAPTVRLVEDDPSYVTLQEVWEHHCGERKLHKDIHSKHYMDRMREVYASNNFDKQGKLDRVQLLNFKAEIWEDIANRFMPETILTKFMTRALKSYGDLWAMRKQFTRSLAANTFITQITSIGPRQPHKISISRQTGNVWFHELIPGISHTTFLFTNSEPVPFRFTPNIQHFVTPIGVDGVFAPSIQAIGRALTEPSYEFEDYLSIFVRDELITHQQLFKKAPLQEQQLKEFTLQNCDLMLKRAIGTSCREEREKGIDGAEPANQTILDLISNVVNPHKLCQMDVAFVARL